MSYDIRQANIADFEKIKAIFECAREFFKANGIDQWQNGYPEDDVIKNDIYSGGAYVACDDGRVIAVCTVLFTPDISYGEIDGEWHSDGEYVTVHRVAVSPECKGHGIASLLFSFVEENFIHGGGTLRADTHRDNLSMQRLLEKNGFLKCGIIRLAEGSDRGKERIAYDKIIK